MYLLQILALKLTDQLVQAVVVGFDANGVENLLDILCGWGGVATEAEEKVSCEVLHYGFSMFPCQIMFPPRMPDVGVGLGDLKDTYPLEI